jgi:light-regulated signal transduction histidine kinase (bacteriophytochrome)
MIKGKPVFFIKDNRIGFEMQEYPKFFEVFDRLHSEHDYTGTGIGLALVRKIILSHG